MNLWFRMLYVLVVGLFRPRLGALDTSVMQLHVWPSDLDVNVHMNNARYLSVMDLGRFDLFLRTGMWRVFIRKRWQPLLGAVVVRFRRALRPFEGFTLHSRLIGWDDRRTYMEHWIEVDGKVVAQAVMWAAFRNAAGRVLPADIARELGVTASSPALPDWVARWRDLDAAIPDPMINQMAKAAE